jgi:hypothetical protein
MRNEGFLMVGATNDVENPKCAFKYHHPLVVQKIYGPNKFL